MRTEWKRALVLGSAEFLLAWSIMVTGCSSTKAPGAPGLAAVEIKGHTSLEIARAISEVFQGAGYQPVVLPPNPDLKLQFEKRGSTGAGLVYGDWSSNEIWYRAKIKISRTDPSTFLVSCDAFRVLHRGDPHFEEEHKLSFMKQGGYQELLDQAKAKVESQPGTQG